MEKIIGVNQVLPICPASSAIKRLIPVLNMHLWNVPSVISSKSRQLLAHWFAQVLFQDTNDDRIDLTIFEDVIHQIAKLTSDTVEVKGLTQADIESILFTLPPITHFVVVTSQVG